MPLPLPPGVYFQRADSPVWAVDEARSDIAGFVGVTERGPLHAPVKVESWTQFCTRFGRSRRPYAHLPDAVRGFFANGGRTAWIVRIGQDEPTLHASAVLVNEKNEALYKIWAKDPGIGGRSISVRFVPAVRNRFHLAVDVDVDGGQHETLEIWRDLETGKWRPESSPDSCLPPVKKKGNARYLVKVVNGWPTVDAPDVSKPGATEELGSVLIFIEPLRPEADSRLVGMRLPYRDEKHPADDEREPISPAVRLGWPRNIQPADKSVLTGLKYDHFVGRAATPWGLAQLEAIDEVSIVAIPDVMWRSPSETTFIPASPPCGSRTEDQSPPEPLEIRPELLEAEREQVQLDMLSHCARLHDRFAILDSPYDADAVRIELWAKRLQSASGQFGALYFPWIGVSTREPGVHWMPPSGHLAGMFAGADLGSGVQKSPANTVLAEVQSVFHELDDETHGRLNLEGVNVLKVTRTRGVRAMGARTLIDPRDPDLSPWKFISVRRLLLMLESSLERSAYWLVHTDNRAERWADVERVIRNFLRREWQIGRLGGTTPEEAFSVACNQATNPWEDVERGRMTCVIGVQPPLPAEYVFVRLGDRGAGGGTWSFGGSTDGTA